MTRLILTIHNDEDLNGSTAHDLEYLIRDALYEFVAHRGPTAEAYVENRYPGDAVYSGDNRQRKIASVRKRNKWAEAIHPCQITIQSE